MKKKIPNKYEYIFNGSKLYCDFTEEEKNIYGYYINKYENRDVRARNWIRELPKTNPRLPLAISIISLLLVIAKIFLADMLQ